MKTCFCVVILRCTRLLWICCNYLCCHPRHWFTKLKTPVLNTALMFFTYKLLSTSGLEPMLSSLVIGHEQPTQVMEYSANSITAKVVSHPSLAYLSAVRDLPSHEPHQLRQVHRVLKYYYALSSVVV